MLAQIEGLPIVTKYAAFGANGIAGRREVPATCFSS